MDRDSFIFLGTGLLGILFISLACLKTYQPTIERDLSTRTKEALNLQHLSWATATAEGQTILLTGVAPTQEARNQAGDLARKVYGVTRVDNRLVLAVYNERILPKGSEASVTQGSKAR